MINGKIDLRSDTVTVPTEKMRKVMFEAVVGDDVYGDDATINELERLAAERFGKEAAIFMPTGTMSNQTAVFTWVRNRGDEVILPAYAPLSLLSAVAYVGAYPVLCDADEKTGCLDAKGIPAIITQNTRAILAFHSFGRPCDMDALGKLVEDVCWRNAAAFFGF